MYQNDNKIREKNLNNYQKMFINKNINVICEFYKKCVNDESDSLLKFNYIIKVIKKILKVNIELSFYKSDISS